jgi:hypothetical protein
MPRNRAGGAGDAAEASPAAAAAARASAPDGDPEGVPAGRAGPLDAAGAEDSDGAPAGDAVMDAPREDAFGSTVRGGPLPRLFRAGSRWRTVDLSAEGLRSGEPLLDDDTPEAEAAAPPGADRLPAPDPPPDSEPDLLPDPEPDLLPGPAPALGPEPDAGPPVSRPTPRDDQ